MPRPTKRANGIVRARRVLASGYIIRAPGTNKAYIGSYVAQAYSIKTLLSRRLTMHKRDETAGGLASMAGAWVEPYGGAVAPSITKEALRAHEQALIDAYPDRKLTGHVESVQPGSGTAFSLLPAENATGNYVKVVQRVPVKIIVDNWPSDVPVGPGMSVVPWTKVR